MEKLLSIIIPTYNMSLYIERCMNSLISSKTIEKLDIIVVNDGSKDDSSEKAKHIAISYPNSIRVIDKENGNPGTTWSGPPFVDVITVPNGTASKSDILKLRYRQKTLKTTK